MPPFLILYFCNQLLLSCGWQLLFLMDKLSVFIRNNILLYLDQSNETVLLQFLFQSHFIFFLWRIYVYVCVLSLSYYCLLLFMF